MTNLPRDLAVLRADLAAAKLPVSRKRVALMTLAAGVTITAAAFAANHYLGQPAPAHVNATFAQLIDDPRWPVKPVLRETAKVVAFSPHGMLYGAQARDGSDCLEFVTTRGTTYWVFCANINTDRGMVLIPPMPFRGTPRSVPPYVLVGRISDRGTHIDARLPDGRTERVELGLRGYFVFEPQYQAAARRGDLQLVERDRAGSITDRVQIPPQIVVSAVGVPPSHVTGYVTAPRARYASFVVAAPDTNSSAGGAAERTGYAPIGKDGRFSWDVPRLRARNWVVDVLLVDSRFVPLTRDQDAFPIPDARFWKHARAEAARG